jgi:hypothetical protein
VAFFALSSIWTLILHDWITPRPVPRSVAAVVNDYTPADCSSVTDPIDASQTCSVQITPREIKLRFVSKAEATEEFGAASVANKASVAAFTYVNHNPCEILIPVEGTIEVQPKFGLASWGYKTLSGGHSLIDLVVHELAHCFAGLWHPDWQTIAFNDQLKRWTDREHLLRYEFESKLPIQYVGGGGGGK